MKYIQMLSVLTLVALVSNQAHAQNISGPSINKGVSEIEHTTYYENDDGDTTIDAEFEYKYGLTDRIGVAIELETIKPDGEDFEIGATEFKVNYELTDKAYYIQSAIRAAYELDHTGDEDSAEIKLMLQKGYGNIRHRMNIDMNHDVGEKSESGIEMDIAYGAYYKINDVRVGMEYFGDFGRLKDGDGYEEQEHQVGPLIDFDVPIAGQEIGMNVGYFGGISSAAADSTFKFEVAAEF